MLEIDEAVRVTYRAVRALVEVSMIPSPLRITAAYYLVCTYCNVRGLTLARVIGVSKQNISKALKKVEDRRDDPDFDAELTRLESIFEGTQV
jgi:hypothetical protein